MAHREELLQTGAVSSVFLGILVGLGYIQQLYFPGAFTDPVLVAVALVPNSSFSLSLAASID